MNSKTIITFVAVCLGVLLGVGGMLWQFGQSSGTKQIPNIEGEKRYVKGNGSIVVTEFSDFQCSACAATQDKELVKLMGENLKSLPEILTKYEGKIQFVYRQFPLPSIHKNAFAAAYAGEAAYQQGKFWEMHDILFAKQSEWANLADPKAKFGEYAKEIGLELEKFKTDSESEETKKIVAKDLAIANQYRLMGTPTFFVNGVEVDFAQLEAKIESLVKTN